MLQYIDIAKNYFREQGETRIIKVLDCGDSVVVYPGSSEDRMGSRGLRVFKDDCRTEPFILPSKENFMILASAKEVPLDSIDCEIR